MKVLCKILIVAFIILSISGCKEYTKFKVSIINDSSSEITEIELGMIGVEKTVSVNSLAVGASTKVFVFLLKKLEEGVPVPISYGDYRGGYSQKGEKKPIFITTPNKKIEIKINDDSYSPI
ncbi:hypothetical protein JW998_07640 [candidate division KSB1 bacterium]|nr:hypothetical protein [candidate division KSB1 bacterium]